MKVLFVCNQNQDRSKTTEISKRFPKEYLQKRIISFNIDDIYQYNQPELINLLNQKILQLNKI